MITNLEIIMFYIALTMIVYSIPKIIKAIGELKQWKDAYDKQERIAKFLEDYDSLVYGKETTQDDENNIIDEQIKELIIYD